MDEIALKFGERCKDAEDESSCTHDCPVAFYSDEHSLFRINREAQGGADMTQFGRALAELNIEIHLRELQPGQGPRRAGEPNPP